MTAASGPDAHATRRDGPAIWLRQAATIARRELRGGLTGFRIFLACLALGVAAIAAVGSVRVSITEGLAREGRIILGGDAEVEFAYRRASPEERAYLERLGEVGEVVDFRSMAATGLGAQADRALTQVKAVDAAYPLTGEVVLDPPMPIAEALADDGIIVHPVLADRLGLSVGDPLWLGSKSFTLRALITREPDAGGAGFGLGPRTIVASAALEGTGLLSEGSLFDTDYRVVIPEATDADLERLEAETEARFADQGMRWRDRRNASPQVQRFVDRMGSFLVLVGLAGLAVGGVGVSAAVRSYLDRKTGVIATLKTLGAEGRVIFAAYMMQIAVLAALGIFLGLILGTLIPLAAGPFIEARLPVPVALGVHPGPLAEAALYGALTALIFTLWPLARTEQVRAASLFRDATGPARGWPRRRYLVALGLSLAVLVGLSAWLSGIPTLALWSAGGILVALAVLVAASFAVRRLARVLARHTRGRPALRLALGSVGGPGGEATAVVLSLGLGLTVLAAVGQIDANMRAAIARDLPEIAPSYFFIDIQPNQIGPFLDRVENDPAISRVDTAPMLGALVRSINDRPASEFDHWVTRGDRRISFADAPGEGTRVVAGEFWSEDYEGPPQISFAREEAEELGIELGDTVTLNVLGRDITGTVTNFREVDFSSGGIGFVMVFNTAALEGAPHTWLSTVYAEEEAEARILREVAGDAPNITAIGVRDAIALVTEALSALAAATSWGAGATLLTGFVVLIGAAAAGERGRVFEAAVLKTLGATRATVLASFAIRSAMLGAAAGVVAIAGGAAAGWGIMTFVMEAPYSFEWVSATAIVVGGAVATLLAGLAFAWRPLAARPAQVLRAQE
ncbi:lipoprotein releasing system, transmembrane protein, LolC/E family [Jannaschia seosinensis]|uniref:Lipoprotein releasing system, transmembrane protein, LolC/E family n=1 Tax=Jannaschia seosinensis TaxID=313367 RepID=A0A0M7BDR5_9RHOB|nr:FtsX-like permease family protein [Jannaschia seosinensis]CUH40329.1 lipoprotein releasing system, transmembrane protein, LolC/E family [Jannaschia seosinensis]